MMKTRPEVLWALEAEEQKEQLSFCEYDTKFVERKREERKKGGILGVEVGLLSSVVVGGG